MRSQSGSMIARAARKMGASDDGSASKNAVALPLIEGAIAAQVGQTPVSGA
jgi:hypothetical protein